MTEISKFNSKVKKIYECDYSVDVSVSIMLDEPQARFILIVTSDGCQIKEASE